MRHHLFHSIPAPSGWTKASLKRAFRLITSGNGVIKNTASAEPDEGRFPAFSASGQDVWLSRFDHQGDGLVLSAVGARCGKCFLATGKWSAIAKVFDAQFQRFGVKIKQEKDFEIDKEEIKFNHR